MKIHAEFALIRWAAVCACIVLLGGSARPQTQATYFSYRLGALQQQLDITPSQMPQLRSIVEQETSELMEIVCNPATSRKYKLTTADKILRNSEANMKSVLTPAQYRQLPQLHEQTMQDLKALKPGAGCTKGYWGGY